MRVFLCLKRRLLMINGRVYGLCVTLITCCKVATGFGESCSKNKSKLLMRIKRLYLLFDLGHQVYLRSFSSLCMILVA